MKIDPPSELYPLRKTADRFFTTFVLQHVYLHFD